MKTYVNGPTLRRVLGHLSPYPDEVWVTADGRRLKVGQMDEQHVRNTLRLVLKNRRLEREAQSIKNRRAILRDALRAVVEKHAEECIGEDRKWGSS
jgi:hypothetical protein